ncbi:MAG: leucine-rich repeat domain-containing protein, partial [Spirochaetota bacterium]
MKHIVIFFLVILIGSTCKSSTVKKQKKSSQPSKQTKSETKTKKKPDLLSQSELTYVSQVKQLAAWKKAGKYKGILSLDKVRVIRLTTIEEEENFDLSILAIFTNLQELHINKSKLSAVPASLVKLQQLETLNLTNNKITIIPSWICQLTSLSELNLSNNQVKTLPDSIDKLQELENLQISNNSLYQLPAALGKLQNLETLNLANNRLQLLPNSITKLENLRNVNISYNLLYSLPNKLGNLKSLESLQLENNRLSSLPRSIHTLQQLEELNVARNRLRSLPNTIGNLAALKKLYCENNYLTELPPAFLKLKELEILRLFGNEKIVYLPEFVWNWKEITTESDENPQLFPGETLVDAQYSQKKTSYYILSKLGKYKCIRKREEYDLSGCILRIYHKNKLIRKEEHIYPIRWQNESTFYLGEYYGNQIQKHSLTYNIFRGRHPLLVQKPVYNPDKTYYYKIFNNSTNHIDCRNVYPKYSEKETKEDGSIDEVENKRGGSTCTVKVYANKTHINVFNRNMEVDGWFNTRTLVQWQKIQDPAKDPRAITFDIFTQ